MRDSIAACRRAAFALSLSLLATGTAWGQLRVATWNVSTYDGDPARDAAIQTAVYGEYAGRSFAPDVIVGQEFATATAAAHFRDLLNAAPGSPGDWDEEFVNGPLEGNVIFFRTTKCTYRGAAIISYGGSYPDGPRNVVRFKLRLVGYTSHGASIFCYCSHMKAGNTADDQTRRLTEAQNIRDDAETLAADYLFLLAADLNIPRSSEAAYQELVGSQANNEGRFFDPINSPGFWQDDCSFRFIHSQDPALYGMDDRYDQILVSDNLIDGVGFDYSGNPAIPFSTSTWNDPNHSHRTWGNDGTCCNQTLTTFGNQMVGQAIAQALIDVATSSGGHLPVYIDLRVPAEIGATEVIDFGQVEQGQPAEQTLDVWNAADEDLWTLAGIADLHYQLSASAGFSAPPGPFVEPPGDMGNVHVITMDTSTIGPKSGTVTITSDAPDEPTRVATLMGEVVAPAWCLGDMNCSYGMPEFTDINYFVAAIGSESGWWQYYRDHHGGQDPPCAWLMGDFPGTPAGVEFQDIVPFANSIGQPCIQYGG